MCAVLGYLAHGVTTDRVENQRIAARVNAEVGSLMKSGCLVGLLGLVWGYAGCVGARCNADLALGKNVQVALVDEQGAPAGARGKVQYSNNQTLPFDCGLAPEADFSDINCVNGVLQLAPVSNPSDTIDVVFELGEGSWAEPYRVQLEVEEQVVHEGACGQTIYQGTTKPVIVPAAAKLDNG